MLTYGFALTLPSVSVWHFANARRLPSRLPLTATLRDTGALLRGAQLISGNASSRWKVIEFMDYECPPCAGMEVGAAFLRERHRKKVGLVHSAIPISYPSPGRPLG